MIDPISVAIAGIGTALGIKGAKDARDDAKAQQAKIDEYNQERYDDYLRSLEATLNEATAIQSEQAALQAQGQQIVSDALPYYQPARYYPRVAIDTKRRENQFYRDMQEPGLTQELLSVSPSHAGDVPGPYNAYASSAQSAMMNDITKDLENRAYVGAMSYNPTREMNYAQDEIATPLAIHNTMVQGQVPIYSARMQRAGLQIPADPLELNPSGTPDALSVAGNALVSLAPYAGSSYSTPAVPVPPPYGGGAPRPPTYPGVLYPGTTPTYSGGNSFSNPWWV
jgi:hypothetical protein